MQATRLRDLDIQVGICFFIAVVTSFVCVIIYVATLNLTFHLFLPKLGSFRVLQRYALRASTAAPTVFKPVMMGGEMYCDGGIVASNPAAVAVHEARAIFPDIPIEMVVSIGTGGKSYQ